MHSSRLALLLSRHRLEARRLSSSAERTPARCGCKNLFRFSLQIRASFDSRCRKSSEQGCHTERAAEIRRRVGVLSLVAEPADFP